MSPNQLPTGAAYFGIAWELDVADANGNTILTAKDDGSYQDEPLQIEFECEKNINTDENGFWYAEISIFNLNDIATINTIEFAMQVTLKAGWRTNGSIGTIFSGVVYQPLWERIDGINYKITLRCVTGLAANLNNFVAIPIQSGWNQRQVLEAMAGSAYQVNLDSRLAPKLVSQSRGEVLFGRPDDYMSDISRELGGTSWIDDEVLEVQNINQAQTNVKTYTYDETTGLVGTPEQTEKGVTVSVLLNPNIKLAEQIILPKKVAINMLQRKLTENQNATILSQSGKYGIIAIKHIGDSRGGTWQTQLVCVTYLDDVMALMQS